MRKISAKHMYECINMRACMYECAFIKNTRTGE
jgi:hypothetical protein